MMLTPRQRSVLMSVAALLLMLALSALSSAGAVTQVYRLLQAELDGQQIGSAAYAAQSFMTLPLPGANTFKAILVVPLSLAAPDMLQGHLKASGPGLEALLLVLPEGYDSGALSAADANRLAAVEQLLMDRAPMPIFFAVESQELQQAIEGTQAMFKRGTAPSSTGERYELAIQGVPPTEVKPAQYINYWALLSASEQQAKGVSVAPTVIVTAHYDTFSLAPGLPPQGTDSNASGTVALLALLRAFGRLYASTDSRPPCNLLFLLTSGGPHGFEGARQWLNDADPEFLSKVEFVLALDSIGRAGANGDLHLHSAHQPSKPRTAEAAKGSQWHSALHGAAERAGVTLYDVARAAGSSDREDGGSSRSPAWAHEHFAAMGMAAATLSARAEPYGSMLRGGLAGTSSSSGSSSSGSSSSPSSADSSSSSSSSDGSQASSSRAVDPAAVLAVAQFAADALTRLVFPGLEPGLRLVDVDGRQSVDVDGTGSESGSASSANVDGNGSKGSEGSSSSQLTFARSWLALLARSPRTLPLDQHLEGGEALHSAIARFLREHSSAYKRHLWDRSAIPLRVWGGVEGTLRVYRAASVLFDMVLTLGVVVYLAALFAALRICTRGWGEFEAMFRTTPPTRRASYGGGRGKRA